MHCDVSRMQQAMLEQQHRDRHTRAEADKWLAYLSLSASRQQVNMHVYRRMRFAEKHSAS